MLGGGCEKKDERKGRATDAATSAENTAIRIAKSHLSRSVMNASGVDFLPIAALKSDMIDGDDWREPENAGRGEIYQRTIHIRRRQARTGRSWRCFENKPGYRDDNSRHDA